MYPRIIRLFNEIQGKIEETRQNRLEKLFIFLKRIAIKSNSLSVVVIIFAGLYRTFASQRAQRCFVACRLSHLR